MTSDRYRYKDRVLDFCEMNRIVVCNTIFARMDKYTLVSPAQKTKNQIDQILITKGWRRSVMDGHTQLQTLKAMKEAFKVRRHVTRKRYTFFNFQRPYNISNKTFLFIYIFKRIKLLKIYIFMPKYLYQIFKCIFNKIINKLHTPVSCPNAR